MKEMRRHLQVFFALTAAFLVWAVIWPLTAEAASRYGDGVISMESASDDVYKKADVTGDGKKDTVRKTVSKSGDTRIVKLYVNGTKVKTWKSKSYLPNVKIVTVKKTSYLEIFTESFEGTNACGLYQVKNGKLKKVLDYRKLVNNSLLVGDKFTYTADYWDMMYVTSVKGNEMSMNLWLGTKSLGQIKIRGLILTCKNGTFTLSGKAASVSAEISTSAGITQTFTAKSARKIYSSAGSSKTAFTMKKNTSFTISKAAVRNKEVYVYIKTAAGKKGWLKLSAGGQAFVKNTAMQIWG